MQFLEFIKVDGVEERMVFKIVESICTYSIGKSSLY